MQYCRISITFCVVLLFVSSIKAQPKTELREETAAAFQTYAGRVEAELQKRITGDPASFLAASKKPNWKEVLRAGGVDPQFTERSLSVPGGLIQDWTATIFVSGVTPEEAVAMLTDYERHKAIYPEVVDSRLLAKNGVKMRSYLRLVKEKVFTVVLDTEHDVEVLPGKSGRFQLRSRSNRINEIRDAGTPKEEILPVGKDSGFLWRLNGYWSIEPGDGGVYVECRSVTLTRGIPLGLGWIVKPFTTSLPRESLIATLEATKQELRKRAD